MPQPHQEKFNAFLTPASLAQETGLGLGAQAGELQTAADGIGRWFLAAPPRRRNTLQHRPRSAAVTLGALERGS